MPFIVAQQRCFFFAVERQLALHSNSLPSTAQLGHHYLREDIPALFGLTFNSVIWNQGFVAVDGRAALFIYCGRIDFQSSHGQQPISVEWQLRDPIPASIRSTLRVPASAS